MLKKIAASGLVLCAPALAHAGIDSIDLSQYRLVSTHALPMPWSAEASAVTWNWDTGTLFLVGDEGGTSTHSIVEVSTTGTLVSRMSLVGFQDTEALTYMGNGQFAIGEERLQDVYRLTYQAGGSVTRSTLPWSSFGPTVGNIGLEGVSYDPSTGRFIGVREAPQMVYDANLNGFTGDTAVVSQMFTPNLGVSDLSDVQVLSTVTNPGSPDAQNLLIHSQESRMLMEVSRSGTVLSYFNFASIPNTSSIEGVTIADDGTIYLVGEDPVPTLFVLKPVPLPAAAWFLLSGLAGLVGTGVRRRRAAAV